MKLSLKQRYLAVGAATFAIIIGATGVAAAIGGIGGNGPGAGAAVTGQRAEKADDSNTLIVGEGDDAEQAGQAESGS